MSDLYNDAFDAGKRQALNELAPLVDAINDAIFMFEDIAKARQLPSSPEIQSQYVAMGKQLRRLLAMSGLNK